jgi:hypothetical protein
LALEMACNNMLVVPPDETSALHLIETARDHLRSIALDWPQRFPELVTTRSPMDWLRGCPIALATTQKFTDVELAWTALTQLRLWMESQILDRSVGNWLAAHRDPDTLLTWCKAQSAKLLPAACLSTSQALHPVWVPETRALTVLDLDPACQRVNLEHLTHSWMNQSDFAQYPTWLGSCAENGPWTRLRHRLRSVSSQHTSWIRLSARWMELIEIANVNRRTLATDDAPFLASGAINLADGQALAWCEMARGLLFHWVQLDAEGKVQDYRVVAPTEWNFHPGGALARAVAVLSPGQSQMAQLLAAAFDPCVTCTVR